MTYEHTDHMNAKIVADIATDDLGGQSIPFVRIEIAEERPRHTAELFLSSDDARALAAALLRLAEQIEPGRRAR